MPSRGVPIQVTLVSITENLDFTTPWSKHGLAVLGALAEIYINKLREETKKGKKVGLDGDN